MAKQSVTDDGDPRKYYAAIPNIIFTLGLNPYELTLYVYLKKVAGESGTCWQSTASIARGCHMSVGVVSKLKASLAKARPELSGKPLILIASEMQNGGNPNHGITITDIWPENMAELARVRQVKASRSLSKGARSCGEGARSPDERTRSRGGSKEEPINKNPKEAKSDFMSSLRKDPLYSHVDFDSEIEKMRRWLALPANKDRRLTERFVVNWLNKIDRPVSLPSAGATVDRAAKEAELAKRMGWDKLDRTA